MRTDGLSFERIPPRWLPFSYFRRAPLFGLLAGLLLAARPELLEARWSSPALIFAHLLGAGFALQIMAGALCQMLPVVGGQPLADSDRWPLWLGRMMAVGLLVLIAAFGSRQPLLYLTAAVLFGGTLLLWLGTLARALWRCSPAGNTIRVIRLAAFSLLITVLLGGWQAVAHGHPALVTYSPALTDAHLGWAVLGWIMLLIVGVSLQVIPMFHVTPEFPGWVHRLLAPLWLGALLASLLPLPGLLPRSLLGMLVALYALTALRLLTRRKRKVRDYTVRFWQLSLMMLLAFALLLPLADRAAVAMPLALLASGSVIGIMLGLLQKIVPFLLYLHLQRACIHDPMAMLKLPSMKELLPDRRAAVQFRLHAASLILLMLALAGWELPARLAGLTLAASFLWLWLSTRNACLLADRSIPATPEPA